MGTVIIIADQYGRLANCCFRFAHLIAFGREHGVRVVNPGFGEYADCFAGTIGSQFCAFPPPRFRMRLPGLRAASHRLISRMIHSSCNRPGSRLFRFTSLKDDEKLDLDQDQRLSEGMFHFVQGWQFRGYHLLQKHKSAVLAFFRPAPPIEKRVGEFLAAVRPGCDLLVGVHIRRTDYATFNQGEFFYDFQQYAQVMRRVRDLVPGRKAKFLVCSDEAIDTARFTDLASLPGLGHFVEDLYSLSGCHLLIGPPSTFSLWASLYGNVPLYFIQDPDKPITLAEFQLRY